MADHHESRRSEAARPAPAPAAGPDTLQPTLAPEAPPQGALALASQPAESPATQAGSPPDLSPYDWYPVLRRPRADGWTVDVQRRFIEVLADSGSVDQACRAVGKSKSSAYALRRAPGAEGFAAAWRIAIDNAAARALDECFERALVGSDEPVFDREGNRVGRRLRQSDRLLMFILRAYMPDRFRHAARDTRLPGERPAPAVEPLRTAITHVAPPCPADPGSTMDADELDCRLLCADIAQGRPMRWHTGLPEDDDRQDTPAPAIGPRFEEMLDAIKRANAGLPDGLGDGEEDGT